MMFQNAIKAAFFLALLCTVTLRLFGQIENASSQKKYDLVVCAIFQDEEFFLKEWIEFHKLMGVQHFYLYDNLSSDASIDILKPYIDSGVVDLFDWPVITNNQKEYLENLQIPAYLHALNIAKETAHWAAFIDIDEFLFPVRHQNLVEFLAEYHPYAAVAVNWQIFGTSWLEKLPNDGLITENLIYKAPEDLPMNQLVKLIVQPCYVKSIISPHIFIYHDNLFAVNSVGKPLLNGVEGQPVFIKDIRINHYWCGTYDWLITQKIPRRRRWGFEISPATLDGIITLFNQTKDESLLRFSTELKRKMDK